MLAKADYARAAMFFGQLVSGSVTLEATNAGQMEHEVVVVRTDLPADALPTKEDGTFDEAAEGVEVLGEIEPFAPGTTERLTLDLPAGHYAFLCNVVDTTGYKPFSHHAAGMYVDVEVRGRLGEPSADGQPGGLAGLGLDERAKRTPISCSPKDADFCKQRPRSSDSHERRALYSSSLSEGLTAGPREWYARPAALAAGLAS